MATENSSAAKRSGWRALFDPDGPWVWLVFLPFYAFPWIFEPPNSSTLLASATGLAVFLALYVIAGRAKSGSPWIVLAITVIAVLLAPFQANWAVIPVYAAALAADTRPARRAMMLIGLVCLVIVVTGLAFSHHAIWWGPAVLLAAMVGVSNVSAAALRDKNTELQLAHDEVRTLSRIAERERIGRDLHDLLGRTLTLIAVKADLAERLAAQDAKASVEEIREIGTAAREGLREVRDALAGVRQQGLAHEVAAARAMLESAGIACQIEGHMALVPADRGAVLAMALREAVTNVVRHSEASHCTIVLSRNGGDACLQVADNGRGGAVCEGMGLAGMQARLKAAGGALQLLSADSGTRLVARIPVP